MKVDAGRKTLLAFSGLLVAFVLLGGVLGRSLAGEGTYTYLKLFNEVLYLVRNNYVEAVEEETLMEGAYRGMLESLDPQSEYLTTAEFRRASRGEKNGPADVGLVLSKRGGYAAVISALEGSPAQKAGLGTGDRLLTIDLRSTRSMGSWEATQALQGKTGTTVRVSVVRGDSGKREEIRLVRRVPTRSALVATMPEPGAGLLKLGDLQSGDGERVRRALGTLKGQGASRLILDLRSNPGTSTEEAVRVAGLFKGEGKVAMLAERQTGSTDLSPPPGDPVWTGPLAVLIDSGTASGAEILAAALSERSGGTLVGEKTWGLGSLQKVISLPGGDGVRISVGKYLTPSGKDWNGSGLTPDVVESGPTASAAGEDPQLKKGLEVLKQAAPKRKAA